MSKRVAIESKDHVQAVTKAIVSGSMGTLDRIPSSVLGIIFDFIPNVSLFDDMNPLDIQMPGIYIISVGGSPSLYMFRLMLLVCRGFYVSVKKHTAVTKTVYMDNCWFRNVPVIFLRPITKLMKSVYPKLQAVVVPLPDWAFGDDYTEWLSEYIRLVEREYLSAMAITYNVVYTPIQLGRVTTSQIAAIMKDKQLTISSDVSTIDRAFIVGLSMRVGIKIKGYTFILPGSKACGKCELKDEPLVSFKCDALDCKHKDRLMCSLCVVASPFGMLLCNDGRNKRIHEECVYYPPGCTSGCKGSRFKGFVPDPADRVHIYSGDLIREFIDEGMCLRHIVPCISCGGGWANAEVEMEYEDDYNHAFDLVARGINSTKNKIEGLPDCISVLFKERMSADGHFKCAECDRTERLTQANRLYRTAIQSQHSSSDEDDDDNDE